MRLLSVITALIVLPTQIYGDNLPDEFFGKFSLDHSDNFDAYLSARGFSWLMRRILPLIHIHVDFTKAGENSFNYDFMTIIKDYHFQNVVFGQEVKTETMYNKKVKVIFTFRNGRLYGNQFPIDPKDHDLESVYSYEVNGDTMVLTLFEKGVVAKLYFKRQ